MRQAAWAILVALGLYASAEEGAQLSPRIRLLGEKGVQQKLVVPEKLLEASKMTDADKESVRKEVAKLNADREKLIKDLEGARTEVLEARKKYNGILTALDQQQVELQKSLETRLGAETARDFGIRIELQPITDWLQLTEKQVGEIVDEEKKLLADDPRPKIVEAARTARDAAAAGPPLSAEDRKKQVDLLTAVMDFNSKWLANIRAKLTPEQQKLWDDRYRTTQYLVEGAK